jgi:hypothetical protein
LTLIVSFLDHPDARNLADQLDGELASIYGGLTIGRDVTTGRLGSGKLHRHRVRHHGLRATVGGDAIPVLHGAVRSSHYEQ